MSPLNRRQLLAATAVVAGTTAAGLARADVSSAASRYPEYDKYFNPGPKAYPGVDTSWVPQGLTHWGNDKLLISYYDGRYGDSDYKKRAKSRLFIVSRKTGATLNWFQLNTQRHVGGLATTPGYIWVSMDSRLLRYPTSRFSQSNGSIIHASKEFDVKGKASYVGSYGNTLWTGTCNPEHRDYMYAYPVDGSGNLPKNPTATVRTPSQVQGLAVTGSLFIWSQSWGSKDSNLIYWRRSRTYDGTKAKGNWIVTAPRAEGLTYVNGQVHVIFESGSSKYADSSRGIRVKTIHHGNLPPVP